MTIIIQMSELCLEIGNSDNYTPGPLVGAGKHACRLMDTLARQGREESLGEPGEPSAAAAAPTRRSQSDRLGVID